MLKMDNVEYGDTKLIELETFINMAFDDRQAEDMTAVVFRVFQDGEMVHEEPFSKSAAGKYYVNWRTHELPEPDTYKVMILIEYGDDKRIDQGFVKVEPSADDVDYDPPVA